jgi:signal peptidase II
MPMNRAKTRLFVVLLAAVVLLDLATKLIVQRTFRPLEQVDVIGSLVRLTYIHNPGAAFGIYLGGHSRAIFLGLSAIALVVLIAMYTWTPARDGIRLTALALICSGALGNLIDRVRSPQGVIDFIDVGVGDLRWPIFNVADMAVTTGAVVLALSLWREDKRAESGE